MVEIISKSNERSESIRKASKCLENELFEVKVIQNKDVNSVNKDDQNDKGNGNDKKQPKPSNFEEAINATGFGKCNYLIILCALPAFCTNVYVTSSVSYIMSSAECDLDMSMADMGRLNTFTYAGMFCSALVWGFLSDTLGRKNVMIFGFITLSIIELIASLSTTYLMLSLAKFCAGLIFNGPFAILLSYISETHAASIRATVFVSIGLYYPFANLNLPLLAWGIIPRDWNISLFDGAYVLHSWQIFLAMFSLPPLITGLSMMLLPESPKFLMSRGRNEEALKVFQRMYSMNKGCPKEEYPIKELVEERDDGTTAPCGWKAIKAGFQQLKPLFCPPHLKNLILSCFIMLSFMYGGNTLRLWFPQISTIVEDYYNKNTETSSLCTILDSYVSNKITDENVEEVFKECVKVDSGSETYVNSIIIGSAGFIAYFGAGCLVSVLGNRNLTAFATIINGICAVSLYWSRSFPEIVSLFAIFVSISSVAGTLLSSIAVELFPTSMRAMAVAVFLMTGRLGTVIGGVTFSYLLELGCLAPFVVIGSIQIISGLLCFVLPKTNSKKKQ